MKNRIFAAIAAAAMLCCTLVSPASAAETYQKGDVNMDGKIDVADAQLAVMAVLETWIGLECPLNEEQIQLISLTNSTVEQYATGVVYDFGFADAYLIFRYTTDKLVNDNLPDIITFYNQLTSNQ